HIEVKTTYSLNITDAITVEAWVKPFKDTSIIRDTHIKGLKFGYNPSVVNVYNNTYAIAAQDYGSQDLTLITFNISLDGIVTQLDPSIPNNETIFADKGDKPDIIKHGINDSLFIIAYENGSVSQPVGVLCSLNISKNGSINPTRIDELIFNTSTCFTPDLIHISDDLYAVVYHAGPENKPGAGVMTTINIDDEGYFTRLNDFTFNNSGCYNPSVIHVTGDLYAIVYSNSLNDGILATFEITSSGSISKINDFNFNSSGCFLPSLINVTDEVYAITYYSPTKQPSNGVLTTVHIEADGSISKIQDYEFVSNPKNCYETKIANYATDQFVIIYNNAENNGEAFLKTFKIYSNGTIKDTKEPWEPESLVDPFHEPTSFVHLTGRIFAIGFRYYAEGSGHPGHIMTLKIGEDPTPIHERGIVRAGAATVYAQFPKGPDNIVKIYGCINDESNLIEANVTADMWHHIVLTYDGTMIRLYCDGVEQENKSYSGLINIPVNNFLFGNIFYGLIDEIAIVDRALSVDEIIYHYNNPGIFENEP
ncbi:MAG: LamG domain-containing protein, partial [Thermoplasmatales archaeon]